MSDQKDSTIKLLLIGESGVGKSSLLLRFSEDTFNPVYITTVGIDFRVKNIELDGSKMKLQIWDTAGQERFRTIVSSYYRGVMGIVLVYDITNRESFNNIEYWMRNIEANADQNVNKILIGNKCDAEDKRVVSNEEGQQMASRLGLPFLETSAKNSLNVDECFTQLARDVRTRLGGSAESSKGTVDVRSQKKEVTTGGCC
ncbi:Ras-related protein Rab-1 [Entamoeba marina]